MLNPIRFGVVCSLLYITTGFSALMPDVHQLDASPEIDGRLKSNSIIDIVPHQSTVWFGTGSGLTQLYLDGSGMVTVGENDGIGRGGVSAITVTDSVIWTATAYTERVKGDYYPAGGGVGYSYDDGITWTWMSQPVDPSDVEDYSPTTTNSQNVTYDIMISNSAVWITSWGGGLRKKRHDSDEWQVVTPDGQPFSPLLWYNHRAFAAVYANNTLFVGTAAGINRSTNEGRTWDLSSFEVDAPSISGNFITAMAFQETGNFSNIWAATWKADGAYEYYGVSVSEDNGAHWDVALSDSTVLPSGDYLVDVYGNLRAHNFGFRGDTVYVAADNGLWISHDNGYNWGTGPLQNIIDASNGEQLSGVDFYSVQSIGDSLWIGTDAGLVVGWFDLLINDFTWRIHRAHRTPGVAGEPEVYAYPNPFSPRRGYITRFQLNLTSPADASYQVWDFAMKPVFKSRTVSLPGGGVGDMAGYAALRWDGKNAEGKIVANGVYFYKVKAGDRSWWGKIMVLD